MRVGVAVLSLAALTTLAPEAAADKAAEPTAGGEVRVGWQSSGGGWPSAGVYAELTVLPGWSVGVGYEAMRVYDGTLRTSADTARSPIVLGGARLGAWRRFGPARGWSTASGVLAGIAHPALAVAAGPAGSERGWVFEAGGDLRGGWTGSRLTAAVFATLLKSYGEVRNEGPGFSDTEPIAGISLMLGLAIGACF